MDFETVAVKFVASRFLSFLARPFLMCHPHMRADIVGLEVCYLPTVFSIKYGM